MAKSRISKYSKRSKRSKRSSRSRRSKGVKIPIDKDTQIAGYHFSLPNKKRYQVLNKAVKKLSYATVIRRLNALSIVHKNTNPKYSKIAKFDMKYLKESLKN